MFMLSCICGRVDCSVSMSIRNEARLLFSISEEMANERVRESRLHWAWKSAVRSPVESWAVVAESAFNEAVISGAVMRSSPSVQSRRFRVARASMKPVRGSNEPSESSCMAPNMVLSARWNA